MWGKKSHCLCSYGIFQVAEPSRAWRLEVYSFGCYLKHGRYRNEAGGRDGSWMSDSEEAAKLAEVKAVLRRLQRIATDGDRQGSEATSWPRSTTRISSDSNGAEPVLPPAQRAGGALPKATGVSEPAFAYNAPVTAANSAPAPAPTEQWRVADAAQKPIPPARATETPRATKPKSYRMLVLSGIVIGGATAAVAYYHRPLLTLAGLEQWLPPNDPAVAEAVPVAVAPNQTDAATPAVPSMPGSRPTIEEVLVKAGADLEAGRVVAARQMLMVVEASGSPEIALLLGRTYDPTILSQIPQADAPPKTTEAIKWYRTWHERSVAQGLVNQTGPLERLLRPLQ